MLKILKIALKEIELIKSQRIAIGLILLYPIIVIFTLALAFGGNAYLTTLAGEQSLATVDAVIFVPETSEYFNPDDFFDRISSFEGIKLHKASSPEEVKEAIGLEIARVGIIVNEPTGRNQPVELELYFDNTALLASRIIASNTALILDSLSGEQSKEILSKIWVDLSEIQSGIVNEIEKTDIFIEELEEANQNLINFNQSLSEIDLSEVKEDLDSYNSYYDKYNREINEVKSDSIYAKNTLDSYKVQFVNAKEELEIYSEELKNIRDQLAQIKQSLVDPSQELFAYLEDIENNLSSKIADIDSAILEIDDAIDKIDETKSKIVRITGKLDEVSLLLEQSNRSVEEFRKTVNLMDQTIETSKRLASETLLIHQQTLQDLKNTKILLTGLNESFLRFEEYKPEYLVNPIKIDKKRLYEVSDLNVMAPVGIAIVLLMACILLTGISVIIERREGMAFRAMISPTSKFSWVAGKILGQLFFAFIEVIILLIIAFIFFGVHSIGNPIDLIIVVFLISFSFTALGFFITNFTKTQSTTILGSLLIIIPIIFLGGVLFPLELMPAGAMLIGKVLPFTIAINLLESVMIKGISVFLFPGSILLLLVPSIILIVLSLLKKEI